MRKQTLPRPQIPNLRRMIIPTTNQNPSLLIDSQSSHQVRMSFECSHTFSRRGVPDFNEFVVGSGDDEIAGGGELDAGETALMPYETTEDVSGTDGPELHHTISSGGNYVVVEKMNSIDRSAITCENSKELTCLPVPNSNG